MQIRDLMFLHSITRCFAQLLALFLKLQNQLHSEMFHLTLIILELNDSYNYSAPRI
jgi:hypothetical protein